MIFCGFIVQHTGTAKVFVKPAYVTGSTSGASVNVVGDGFYGKRWNSFCFEPTFV